MALCFPLLPWQKKKSVQKKPLLMNADIWDSNSEYIGRIRIISKLTPPTIAGLHHTKLLERRAPRIGGLSESNNYKFKEFETDLDLPIRAPIPD